MSLFLQKVDDFSHLPLAQDRDLKCQIGAAGCQLLVMTLGAEDQEGDHDGDETQSQA